VVVDLDGEDEERFPSRPRARLPSLARTDVVRGLLASGLWTALRTRPFGLVPDPDVTPRSLFVTAMDTQPLAPDVGAIVAAAADDFRAGLDVLSRLGAGRTYVCCAPHADVPGDGLPGVEVVRFVGPHPAGLAGTHIHHLDPVGPGRTAWHVGAQDVIAIGALFTTGRLRVERIVALTGPLVRDPGLLRTRLGAHVPDLLAGRPMEAAARVVSGSVLSGHEATGPRAWLGRTHQQVCVLPEGDGGRRAPPSYAGLRRPRRPFAPTAALRGRRTVFWPLEAFERVLPRGFLASALLRALLVGDDERARALGCLELVEEDLALATWLCPGRIDHGRTLRGALSRLAKEA
jgi:Na+-transporting NADH:ubiquinone oxidoreductase subunit A